MQQRQYRVWISGIEAVKRELGVSMVYDLFLRHNWLSNRVFASYDEIVDRCCNAWNRLVDQPWRITSLAPRAWAHGRDL